MHVLLTGATGRCGRYALDQLIAEGHSVLATDVKEAPESRPLPTAPGVEFRKADLCSLKDVDGLFGGDKAFDGVIHLGAIPQPYPHIDDREVHNNNVVGSYNVLRTAVDHGIKRIVQASSVNAHGLSYAPAGHTKFDRFPIDENVDRRPEDAYATSKHECEIQADALVRWAPGTRIASLRPHMVRDSYADSWPDTGSRDLFSWVTYEAVARACILGLTSEGWSGHEVFNVVAPETCWEGTPDAQQTTGTLEPGRPQATTLELLAKFWPGVPVDEAYFAENPRRAVWDSRKAERLLGWVHG